MTMRVLVGIQGKTPLLMNRFTEEAAQSVPGGPKQTVSTMKSRNQTPGEQAEPKLYLTKEGKGKPYLPGQNLYRAIIDAGIFHKDGKRQLTTGKTSLITGGVLMEDVECLLTGSSWEVDSRPVVNPSTRGRMMCHRPRFDKWSCEFTLEVDEAMYSTDLVRDLVDDAGKRIGVGDFRPACKGLFGRFVVTKWEILE
jgi:hypothetical protein